MQAVSSADVDAAVKEAWGRDLRGAHRAADALAKLTNTELCALSFFAHIEASDTAAGRSWRDRALSAAAALSKIDSALFRTALLLAIRRKAGSTEPDPLSPFTADTSGHDDEGAR